MAKNTGKVREKSGNFVSPGKVGTLTLSKSSWHYIWMNSTLAYFQDELPISCWFCCHAFMKLVGIIPVLLRDQTQKGRQNCLLPWWIIVVHNTQWQACNVNAALSLTYLYNDYSWTKCPYMGCLPFSCMPHNYSVNLSSLEPCFTCILI